MTAQSSFTFTYQGREFLAEVHMDYDSCYPWENEDGHGPVREISHRNEKRAGEVLLNGPWDFRHSTNFAYDREAAQKIALANAWGPTIDGVSKRQRAAAAVDEDIKHLKDFLADVWEYVGIDVRQLDAEGRPIGIEFTNALWCIESSNESYLHQVAEELAEQSIFIAAASFDPCI